MRAFIFSRPLALAMILTLAPEAEKMPVSQCDSLAYTICTDLFPAIAGAHVTANLISMLQMAVLCGFAGATHRVAAKPQPEAQPWSVNPHKLLPQILSHPLLAALLREFLYRDGREFLSYVLKYANYMCLLYTGSWFDLSLFSAEM